ncbi:MAG: 50S ribosomal protein L17 [Parcubacteria group bacterium GW2011_GWA2_38_13b]|nr:MAG: 50S ribosomal protein L17 [Parcubacteria group bacterium GW2011_GWA2_38_13b]
MRHRIKGKKFSRTNKIRKAFIRSLVVALLDKEKIITTEARAKALRSRTEKLITVAKKGNLQAIKRLHSLLPKNTVKKAMDIAGKYKERRGGYIRISKILNRVSDKAKMAIVEFV